MNLPAAPKPCNKCGSKINWDRKLREQEHTQLPLNLDATVHTREICDEIQTQKALNQEVQEFHQSLPNKQTNDSSSTTFKLDDSMITTFTHKELAKYTVDVRREGIEQGKQEGKNTEIKRMHDENVHALQELTSAINKVSRLISIKFNLTE